MDLVTKSQFIKDLPKVELHMHLEGSLEPELMIEIAKRNNVEIPFTSAEQIREASVFTSLQSFLDLYYLGHSVFKTRQDFYDLIWAYFKRVSTGNLRHTEIFFEAQEHVNRGVKLEDIVLGLHDACVQAKKEYGITCGLILTLLRHFPPENMMDLLKQAVPLKEYIVGIGMSSSEAGCPPSLYVDIFNFAREQGWHVTSHAGEIGPPEYVRDSIELLKIERCDHGIGARTRPDIVKLLADKEIGVTMCPISNVLLKVTESIPYSPIRQYLDANVKMCFNSDDPSYFGSNYIDENYAAVEKEMGLSVREWVKIVQDAIDMSWAEDDVRAKLQAELDSVKEKYKVKELYGIE
ncbi:uncharacterized protein V2V93DRAFT_362977 [Kockiozyma suomiensis]|uniref:uncharacterized protein n=1 Tax=Kockiozyma suomiensis TaxID=1337062 RepID=UPI003344259E